MRFIEFTEVSLNLSNTLKYNSLHLCASAFRLNYFWNMETPTKKRGTPRPYNKHNIF